jgi:hypothetical protein
MSWFTTSVKSGTGNRTFTVFAPYYLGRLKRAGYFNVTSKANPNKTVKVTVNQNQYPELLLQPYYEGGDSLTVSSGGGCIQFEIITNKRIIGLYAPDGYWTMEQVDESMTFQDVNDLNKYYVAVENELNYDGFYDIEGDPGASGGVLITINMYVSRNPTSTRRYWTYYLDAGDEHSDDSSLMLDITQLAQGE